MRLRLQGVPSTPPVSGMGYNKGSPDPARRTGVLEERITLSLTTGYKLGVTILLSICASLTPAQLRLARGERVFSTLQGNRQWQRNWSV